MCNKYWNFRPWFVVLPSIALQHISAWLLIYFLLRHFASAIAACVNCAGLSANNSSVLTQYPSQTQCQIYSCTVAPSAYDCLAKRCVKLSERWQDIRLIAR
jgi:hypothetical protein